MTCNPTFPINIKVENSKGKCNTKCKLECKYHNSSCIAKNMEGYISLSYDQIPEPPIKYNDVSLDVKEIRIYSPSLHTYNGIHTDGEMLIIHKNHNTNLVVCIPIIKDDKNTNNNLNEIIEKCSSVIPNVNEESTLDLTDYNLSNFIPLNSLFFHYTCTVPFDCSQKYDAIVFGNVSEYISISLEKLEILRTIIAEEVYDVNNNAVFFMNESGISDKIGNSYVRCYKKDELPEEVKQAYNITEGFSKVDINNFIEDASSIHIIYILGSIFGIYGFYWFISNFKKGRK